MGDRILNYFIKTLTWLFKDTVLSDFQRIFIEMLECEVIKINDALGANHQHFKVNNLIKPKQFLPGLSIHVQDYAKCSEKNKKPKVKR